MRRIPLAGGRTAGLEACQVMGILNATPDSFSDGGELDGPEAIERRVASLLEGGVDMLDVGGESTRPGHTPVAADEQIRRVLPVLAAIRRLDATIPISIDTRSAAVAEAALDAGASFVNDVSGLADAGMADVVKQHGCAVVLMRHQGLVGDIVPACRAELEALVERARASGVQDAAIIVDPGLGFGDRPGASVEDNLALVDHLSDVAMGLPVLIGASRKRFVGALAAESDPRWRVTGSVQVAVRAARAGASIVRVHDVAETLAGLRQAGLRG